MSLNIRKYRLYCVARTALMRLHSYDEIQLNYRGGGEKDAEGGDTIEFWLCRSKNPYETNHS